MKTPWVSGDSADFCCCKDRQTTGNLDTAKNFELQTTIKTVTHLVVVLERHHITNSETGKPTKTTFQTRKKRYFRSKPMHLLWAKGTVEMSELKVNWRTNRTTDKNRNQKNPVFMGPVINCFPCDIRNSQMIFRSFIRRIKSATLASQNAGLYDSDVRFDGWLRNFKTANGTKDKLKPMKCFFLANSCSFARFVFRGTSVRWFVFGSVHRFGLLSSIQIQSDSVKFWQSVQTYCGLL